MPTGSQSTSDFPARVAYCCKRVGNASLLARKVGVTPASIGKYLRGAEPNRAILVGIASAAAVDLTWLATGEEPLGCGSESIGPQLLRFLEWSTRTISAPQDAKILSDRCGISGTRIEEIVATGRWSADELLSLANHFDPQPKLPDPKAPPSDPRTKESDPAPDYGFLRGADKDWAGWSPSDALATISALLAFKRSLAPGPYHLAKVEDDSMEPTLMRDDHVLLQSGESFSGPGIYLIRSAEREFLTTLSWKDDVLVGYSNNLTYRAQSEFNFSANRHKLLGKVVVHLRRTKPERAPREG